MDASIMSTEEKREILFTPDGWKRLCLEPDIVQQAIDLMHDGMLLITPEERIVSVNPAGEQILGLDEQILYSLKVSELPFVYYRLDGSVMPIDEMPFYQTLKTQASVNNVIVGLKKADGPLVWIGGNVASIRATAGDSTVLVTFSDVTGMLQAQRDLESSLYQLDQKVQELHLANNRLTRAQEAAKIGTWEWNIQDNTLIWSDEMFNIFGVPREFTPGVESVSTLFAPDGRHLFSTECIGKILEQESFTVTSRTIDQRTTETKYIDVHMKTTRDETAHLQSLVGTVRDITARKREEESRLELEREFQQAQKFKSLGMLAGGVAHDLNNLLMGVLGNADLALIDSSPSSPMRAYLRNIKSTSLQIAGLLKQMLAYAGKGKLVTRRINLFELIQSLRSLLEASVPKNVAVRYEFPQASAFLDADENQIQQVLMNLVINASEASSGRNGTISIRVDTIQADRRMLDESLHGKELPEGCYALLEVSDSGEGMSPEVQKMIFDPFFTAKFTGRGLGLAATSGIVLGHKGASRVLSEPQKGSTFQVILPCAAPAETPIETPPPPQQEPWEGGDVLLVDDDPVVCQVARQMLERGGCRVEIATNGSEALEILREQDGEIDLVILDLSMPQMGGVEALNRIRQEHRDLPVLLSSGYSEQHAVIQVDEQAISGCIQKPYDYQSLIQRVRDVLNTARRNHG